MAERILYRGKKLFIVKVKFDFIWKRGEYKWRVIIVRTVILMIVVIVGIAIKIVKVLSWIGIVYLIKIRKLFRKFWIEEETKLWNRFRKMNSGN